MTLAGIPALKVPDNWPGYDAIAQPVGRPPQRISVKSRTFKPGPAYVAYMATNDFDWLAIVVLPGATEVRRRIFIIPRALADQKARRNRPSAKNPNERYWRVDEVAKKFAAYENNFKLAEGGETP
jgi:hypothetical protein